MVEAFLRASVSAAAKGDWVPQDPHRSVLQPLNRLSPNGKEMPIPHHPVLDALRLQHETHVTAAMCGNGTAMYCPKRSPR